MSDQVRGEARVVRRNDIVMSEEELAAAERESAPFRYKRTLRKLHTLIQSGEGDSETADTLRELMDDAAQGMTPSEVAAMDELSAQLGSAYAQK